MLDPIVQSALVILAAYLIQLLAAKVGIPLDEATVNALAAAIVAFLLGLFGLGVLKRTKAGKAMQARGLLKDE